MMELAEDGPVPPIRSRRTGMERFLLCLTLVLLSSSVGLVVALTLVVTRSGASVQQTPPPSPGGNGSVVVQPTVNRVIAADAQPEASPANGSGPVPAEVDGMVIPDSQPVLDAVDGMVPPDSEPAVDSAGDSVRMDERGTRRRHIQKRPQPEGASAVMRGERNGPLKGFQFSV